MTFLAVVSLPSRMTPLDPLLTA